MIMADLGSDIAAAAAPLLVKSGVVAPYRFQAIAGGGNNRVYRVESATATILLKAYFRHPDDPRDRLTADYGFSRFAWDVGVRALPRPLAEDREAGMAAYEFVEGRKLLAEEVTDLRVDEALAFFRDVNDHRCDPRVTEVPSASEACFTIVDHLGCVERRFERLRGIDPESPSGVQAVDLVEGRMRPAWSRVRAAVAAGSASGDEPLTAGDRCLSPSDFGFHNALLAADGRLRFLDFEYAGWDDPAKMVCDFFCQPALPAPRGTMAWFVEAVARLSRAPEAFIARAALLMPVYELKWCCIMLNEFLPAADRRRTFAGAAAGQGERRAAQLAKVEAALNRMGA